MDEDEELFREMNEEDDFFMGDKEDDELEDLYEDDEDELKNINQNDGTKTTPGQVLKGIGCMIIGGIILVVIAVLLAM